MRGSHVIMTLIPDIGAMTFRNGGGGIGNQTGFDSDSEQ